ncbi:MAG TPA: hypothetical protein VMH87_20475 [Pseudomonadales bacterium]|nr:hypothetical protein [Pseudomonadales bacterium]
MKAINIATVLVLLGCCSSLGQESGSPGQTPFLLARPHSNTGSFVDEAFNPAAFHPPFQPAYTPVNPADLEQRFFPVGLAAFYAAIREKTGETDPVLGFKELAAAAGVDFYPPKTVFLDGMGILLVSTTKKDLDKIQDIIAGLHCPPQQIHIKARFIEIPQKIFAGLQEQYLQQGMTNGVARLTNPQTQIFLHAIQWQNGVKELAEPEITAISGQQTRMQATIIQPLLPNFAPGSPTLDPKIVRVETAGGYFYAGHDSVHPQAGQIETGPAEIGPMLNVVPLILPDGYTISLCVTASDAQFFDYAKTAGLTSSGAPSVPHSQPSTQQTIYDGQTMVLFPTPQQLVFNGQDEKAQERVADFIQQARKKDRDKVLVALVTATLIDEAGNRIHTDEDIPSGVPPPWP